MAKFVGLLVLIVGSVFLRAYVLQMNWEWFVVPLGTTSITLWHTMGLSGMVSMLTTKLPSLKDDKTKDLGEEIGYNIYISYVLTLCGWFFGWLYHFGM